jgi:lysophospholipase L1-like esterase
VLAAALGLAAAALPAAGALAAAPARAGSPAVVGTYSGILLALGDSLAAGYQPSFGLNPPPVSPETGKPDQGYPGSYAADVATAHHLLLVDLACPGETTGSMTTTPAKAACLAGYKSSLGVTSQLAAADRFLAEFPGKVKLVTFDLGANNVDGCATSTGLNATCVAEGQLTIARQLPPILANVKTALAAHDPGALLYAMNYYDPFLGIAYSPGGVLASAAAAVTVGETTALNAVLARAYKAAGIPVANVAAAFKTGTVVPLVTYGGKRLPLDVADVCRWTWMCPLPSTHGTANIHPNTTGYAVIAAAFEAVLPASLA